MIFETFAENEFRWLPELGIGYFPLKEIVYNDAYDDVDYVNDLIGLVNKHTRSDVLCIGVGNGDFITKRENTYGYDINSFAVDWLIQRKLYRHPFKGANSVVFWDSLQKTQDPRLHLSGAKEYVFVSCPIFNDSEEILNSDRYKSKKDCWYFTREGLLTFMDAFGFQPIEINVNKENIGTFVFKKY